MVNIALCGLSSSSVCFRVAGRRKECKRRNMQVRQCSAVKRNNGSSFGMSSKQVEIFSSMEDWARDNILPLRKPVERSWQPQDMLPDPNSDEFVEQISELRARVQDIPDEYFVTLVGDMVTEEALPTYHSRINSVMFFHDETGIDETPWATWTRAWSADENRHGDLLNKYLYLSGRVNMKQIEKTIHYLIQSGADLGTGDNAYLWTIYTSIQERGAAIIHGNTARLAKQYGDIKLAQICGTIASDEKRHESAYSRIVQKLFELEPNETLMAMAYLIRRKIPEPGHLMFDGHDPDLYTHFFINSSKIGVYSAMEYKQVLEYFMAKWDIEKLGGLSSEGNEAQDFVCTTIQRMGKTMEIIDDRAKRSNPISFSWIFDRMG